MFDTGGGLVCSRVGAGAVAATDTCAASLRVLIDLVVGLGTEATLESSGDKRRGKENGL